MKVLIACEESQVVCKEFRFKGHEAYSCDIDECSGKFPEWHIKADVLTVIDDGWDLMIAHPPCTRLANSGVRWLNIPPKGKELSQMFNELEKGAEFYSNLRDADIDKKCIENPVMHKYARELIEIGHKQIVQPWWFGEETFKATGFELINLPDLIPTNKLTPPKKGTPEHRAWSWVHRLPPSPQRARLRSKTAPGIAKAMASQWG